MEQFLLPQARDITFHGRNFRTAVDLERLQEMIDCAHDNGFRLIYCYHIYCDQIDMWRGSERCTIAGIRDCDTIDSVRQMIRGPGIPLPRSLDPYIMILERIMYSRTGRNIAFTKYQDVMRRVDAALTNDITERLCKLLPVCIGIVVMEYVFLQEDYFELRLQRLMQLLQ